MRPPTAVLAPGSLSKRRTRPGRAVRDAAALTQRNLLLYVRMPQLLILTLLQPVIFVLMFRYVFGGSIEPALALTHPGVDYVNYLMPGIFVQTAVFGAMGTGVGLAEDAQKGLIERFRALPMARSAVLAGRTSADAVRNVVVLGLMMAVGLVVGFRPDTTPIRYAVAVGLILFFAYALGWATAAIALSTDSAEAAATATFPFVAVLTFASSAFVVPSLMPGWLQAFAVHQPVTVTIDATRRLLLDQPVEQHALASIAWSTAILLVFAPLAIRRFRAA